MKRTDKKANASVFVDFFLWFRSFAAGNHIRFDAWEFARMCRINAKTDPGLLEMLYLHSR